MTSERNSTLCPKCRKLISLDEKSCPYCGLSRPGSAFRPHFSAELMEPEKLIKMLMIVNVVMYLLSIFLSPGHHGNPLSLFSITAPSSKSLFLLGSTGSIPVFQANRWWTLISASYLHGGLLHIFFNMMALHQIGPLAMKEYGVSRMFIIYTLGGVGGYFLSCLAGIPFTIGASASVCSLLGSLLYFGKSRGGYYGKAVYSQLAGWALGIFFFGLAVDGINNWGHGGGMACGWMLGYFLGYEERARESATHHLLAWLCLGATALALAWGVVSGILLGLFFH